MAQNFEVLRKAPYLLLLLSDERIQLRNNQMEVMQRPRYEGRDAEFPLSLCMPLSQHLEVLINPEALPTPSFRFFIQASLVAQMVKNLPAMEETQVQSLGLEDPLEIWLPTPEYWPSIHSSVLVWRIPWTEKSGGLHTVHGVAKSQT